MTNYSTFKTPLFTSEDEDKQELTPTEDEPDFNIEKSEPSRSNSSSRNEKIVNDITVNGILCGIGSFVTKTYSRLHQRLGLRLAMCSTFCFSVKTLFLEVLTKTVDPFQVVVMIMPIMILGPLIYLIYKHITLPMDYKLYPWLFLSGVSVSAYISFLSLALSKMEMADVVPIVYTSLVFVGLLSWIILKETPTVFHIVFSIMSFLGVVFIARPPFLFGNEINNNEFNDMLIGTGFALGAAFSCAVVATTVRKQCKLGINTFVSMLCIAVIVILTNSVVCTVTGRWRIPCPLECLYATGAGLSYFFAQLTMYFALKFESATYVNIILTIEIVFTFLWQFTFLQVRSLWTSYVGTVLVLAACIGMTLTEKEQETENNPDDAP